METFEYTVIWIAVFAIAIGTYILRSFFLLGIQKIGKLPRRVQMVLSLIPIAVFAALIAPELMHINGNLIVGPTNNRLIAGVIAFVVAWFTESMLLTVGVGMAVLWTLQWI